MNPGKNGVDPDNTENTGSQNDNDRRNDGFSKTAGCCNCAVHKSGHTI